MSTPGTSADAKRILVVEDDSNLSSTIQQMLGLKGYEVTTEGDGMNARNLISVKKFDLVVSDIRLPGLNGIQLLHHVKSTGTPVVLMTGFSEIEDSREAHELGAKGFLCKPFRKQELIDIVDHILFPNGAPPVDLDSQFSALNIEEFTTGNEIQFDIFLRFNASKYVRVAAADHIEHARKAAFLAQQAKTAAKSLHREKIDSNMFSLASELTSTAVDTLCQQPEAASLFETIKGLGDPAYAHCLAVSIYSTLVAKHIGWRSPRSLLRLSMSGLLHDIGKKEIDPKILEKSRLSLTNDEIKLMESHTIRGQEILRELPEVPEEVIQVALQHHEDCKGLGYPMRLTKNHISPLARLVGTVDDLCELCFPASASQQALDPAVALQRMLDTNHGRRDQEFLDALSAVFGGAKPQGL